MFSKSNSKQGDSKASSQSSWTSSGTAASLVTSTNSGLRKDTQKRKTCHSHTEDNPIDWDGLVEDVVNHEVDNIANSLQGKKSTEK